MTEDHADGATPDKRPPLPTPWPDLDEVLSLRPGRLAGLGIYPDSREAEAGYLLAVHAAVHGEQVLYAAPDAPPRPQVPGLQHCTTSPLDIDRLKALVASSRAPIGLVVVDHLQLLRPGPGEAPIHEPEQAEELGVQLKRMAMGEGGRMRAVVALAHYRRRGTQPDINDLGLAAELEYHADCVVLLERPAPGRIEAYIAKDRTGPALRSIVIAG